MIGLVRLLGGCTSAVAASDARIAAACAAATEDPPRVALAEEEPLAKEIPPAHRAVLRAAENGTSLAETGLRGSSDPWCVRELADFLCETYGYTYHRPDIGPRPD